MRLFDYDRFSIIKFIFLITALVVDSGLVIATASSGANPLRFSDSIGTSRTSTQPAEVNIDNTQHDKNNEGLQVGGDLNSKLNSLVTLDLAGQFNVHLSSPSVFRGEDTMEEDRYEHYTKTTPLFRWGKNKGPSVSSQSVSDKLKGINFPYVHVGGQYDFRTVWYGLTRMVTTLSWGKPMDDSRFYHGGYRTNNNQQNNQQLPRLLQRKDWSATVSAEKGLLSLNDYALDCGVAFPITKNLIQSDINQNINDEKLEMNRILKQQQKPSSIALRCETKNRIHGNHATTSLCVKTNFLHPRVQIVGKSIVKLAKNMDGILSFPTFTPSSKLPPLSSSPFLSRIRQQKLRLSDESSWIPDVRITPGGKVISNNSFGFNTTPSSYPKNDNRIGFRMTIKKQINWNILGSIFQHQGGNSLPMSYSQDYDDDDDLSSGNDTLIRLEISGLTGVNSFTSFSVDAALEKIRQSFQCTLLQEGVLN